MNHNLPLVIFDSKILDNCVGYGCQEKSAHERLAGGVQIISHILLKWTN
jgi:hypothetical protein